MVMMIPKIISMMAIDLYPPRTIYNAQNAPILIQDSIVIQVEIGCKEIGQVP